MAPLDSNNSNNNGAKPIKVLIVEDDPVTSVRIAVGMRINGFEIEEVATLEDARKSIKKTAPDLMVLDILLPDGSGLSLIENARKHNIGILCVSAKGEIEDRLAALHLGADDYIVKPVANAELAIKLKNLYERLNQTSNNNDNTRIFLCFADFYCDPLAQCLYNSNNEIVTLTPGEFDVLLVFLQKPKVCISREQIMSLISSDEKIVNGRSVDIMVHRLRRKLEKDHKKPKLFITVYGRGYIFPESVDHFNLTKNDPCKPA